jgi:hypothetical protein
MRPAHLWGGKRTATPHPDFIQIKDTHSYPLYDVSNFLKERKLWPMKYASKSTRASVSNKDLEIIVKTDSGKLGTLLISRGNVEWLPKGNSVNKTRLSWAKFAEVMKENGKPAKAK